MCKVMYHEHAYGPGELPWPTIETPGTPRDSLAMLDAGPALLTEDLADMDSVDTMIHHDAHHGGEIGALRDLSPRDAGGRARRNRRIDWPAWSAR